MTNFQDTLDDFRNNGTWGLATWAGVDAPRDKTEGADFLHTVSDRVVEAAEYAYGRWCAEYLDPDGFRDALQDAAHESIDGMAALIYTATTRQVFVDLYLWDETDEFGGTSIDEAVQHVVYQVGVRLFGALAEALAEAIEMDLLRVDEVRDQLVEALDGRGEFTLAEQVNDWDHRTMLNLLDEDGDVDPINYILREHFGFDAE